ncbi:DUF4189 domain-containing protein [Marilutibacter alkalisoli]|uniref:DUF4189 domain-containing protein n=1 Tax=Marilutibacter alkalisoli TaxID=2591633 RepID=A0A514BVE8_9GAMM|nr:DUF4189 domain-containing protein [Lysobacter alkalisoli]QDH71350.1 DUF4189 domain-containing protein [Lysobacter alkalisoli]
MKLPTILILGLLMVGSAHAQMNNNQYHRHQQQIQNRSHMAEQHRQGYMTQQQQMQQQSPQPPEPTGWWETTWGAIAPSPVGGVLGTAVGASSKEEAERSALEDCKAKGGGACEVRLAYYNQCAVMILGDNIYRTASAGSIRDAEEYGIELCEKEDTSCRVYYSACTEPVFHRY